MKHGKKPTNKQAAIIKNNRLDPRNWLVTKNTQDMLEIVHRISGNVRQLNRGRGYET